MDFFEWLSEQKLQIFINDDKFKTLLKQELDKLQEYMANRRVEVSKFNPQPFFQMLSQELKGYPQLHALLQSLHSNNSTAIFNQTRQVRDWLNAQPVNQVPSAIDVTQQIRTYQDYMGQNQSEDEETSELQKLYQEAIQGTRVEMERIKSMLSDAVSRIDNWNGSPILIKPEAASSQYGGYDIASTRFASISVGTGNMAPEFTLFQDNNGLEIDDVIEGGDDDFFYNPQVQSDYFNLINELRNPGATQKGRILTLYTARPQKDRKMLLQQNTLPVNVFLANSYDHVEGLAHDLSNGEPRDIWKVRIDSKYLTQTLDGQIKYYQVTTQNAPVETMELL